MSMPVSGNYGIGRGSSKAKGGNGFVSFLKHKLSLLKMGTAPNIYAQVKSRITEQLLEDRSIVVSAFLDFLTEPYNRYENSGREFSLEMIKRSNGDILELNVFGKILGEIKNGLSSVISELTISQRAQGFFVLDEFLSAVFQAEEEISKKEEEELGAVSDSAANILEPQIKDQLIQLKGALVKYISLADKDKFDLAVEQIRDREDSSLSQINLSQYKGSSEQLSEAEAWLAAHAEELEKTEES